MEVKLWHLFLVFIFLGFIIATLQKISENIHATLLEWIIGIIGATVFILVFMTIYYNLNTTIFKIGKDD